MRKVALFFILFASVSFAGDIGQIGGGGIGSVSDSAGLAAALSDETGAGAAVFGTSPVFTQIMGVGATTLRSWPAGWDVIQMGAGDESAFVENGDSIIGFVQGMYTTDGAAWKYSQTGTEVCLVDANAGRFVIHTQDAGTEDSTVSMATWHNYYFDYNGNVGVDVVPDTSWYDDFSVVEIGGNAAVLGRRTEGASGTLNALQNAIFDGTNYKYISTDEASMTYQTGGNHGFRTAVSGTAGNNITWINTVLFAPTAAYLYKHVVIGDGTAATDWQVIVDGETNDGYLTWMEDEDYWLFGDDISLLGGESVVLDTSTGSQIGTAAAQKLGLWGATPVVQPSSSGSTTGVTFGTGTSLNDDSCSTGGAGSTCYTLSDVVAHLKTIGVLAQ